MPQDTNPQDRCINCKPTGTNHIKSDHVAMKDGSDRCWGCDCTHFQTNNPSQNQPDTEQADVRELRHLLYELLAVNGQNTEALMDNDIKPREWSSVMAENIDYVMSRITAATEASNRKLLAVIEDKLLDNSIALENEDTAVKWDDVQEVLKAEATKLDSRTEGKG